MVWFNCTTAFGSSLDDAASHGPLAPLPGFGARVTAGGRPPVRAGADLRAQRSRLALVRCLRERRFPSLGSASRRQGGVQLGVPCLPIAPLRDPAGASNESSSSALTPSP